MGLDASVYRDCYETGRLKSQPLPQWKVYVEPNGSRSNGAEDLDLQVAFDGWSNREACEHETTESCTTEFTAASSLEWTT